MELLQLRYFFESAKEESFAKTAEKYLVPTTSVSAAVKRLEAELGEKLFDRTPNRIRLNDSGERLQRALCVAFEELDGATAAIRAKREADREIRLLVRTIRSKVTDHIIEYTAKYPQAKFKAVYDFAVTDFENYDIIIDKSDGCYTEFEKFELYTQRFTIKAAADSHLRGRRLTLRQLSNEPFITMGTETNTHKMLLDICRHAGFTPNIVMQCNDALCYNKCIEAGLGIGISGEALTSDHAIFLDVTDFEERQVTYGYYRRGVADTVQQFIAFLKSKNNAK